ncbi:MAG: MaoC/PaaZ C-terminal domain-containing protein [Burkholderiaceae bacterium]
MSSMSIQIGETVSFEKTVSESDVYMFAGITGDFSGNHVSEAYMRTSKYGHRIAHGALMVGFMSTASSVLIERYLARGMQDTVPVSLGYDRIRFTAPVFFGDTIKVKYSVIEADEARLRTRATIEVTKDDGTVVAVGEHLMKWLPRETAAHSDK